MRSLTKLQLSISINKPDHMAELLEATIKMKNILKDHINIANHTLVTIAITTSVQIIIVHLTQMDINTNQATIMMKSMRVINLTCTSNNTPSEPNNSKEHHESDSSHRILDSFLDLE